MAIAEWWLWLIFQGLALFYIQYFIAYTPIYHIDTNIQKIEIDSFITLTIFKVIFSE